MSKQNRRRMRSYLGSVLSTLFLVSVVCISTSCAQNLDVPYVPTPEPVVNRMLELAQVEPGDYVIDLGSGDGRIVIAAAELGAVGHGIDLDPERISEARENAQSRGVEDRVMFLRQNIFETDFSQASVITMYLLSSVNEKLRPKLLDVLRPGTRIVSHSFDMGNWEPDSAKTVESSIGRNHSIFLWIIPADASGDWNWEVDGKSFTMDVNQEYQKVDIDLEADGSSLSTDRVVLRGKRISFIANDGSNSYVFSGRIEGDSIDGTIQHRSDDDRIFNWMAKRN